MAGHDRRSTVCRPSGIDAHSTSNGAQVHIVPYDRDWPSRFEAERTLLIEAIGPWLVAGSIEHIGSTAIPALDAKPVIDIMAGVESLDGSRAALAVLERHQYCYAPYRTNVMHWLCKPSPVRVGKSALQCSIFQSHIGVSSQVIAKRQLLDPERAPKRDQM